MPQATDLVVKNGAGTDKTFTLLTPAAGYGQPADWALKEGASSTVFPTFSAAATKGSNQARTVRTKFKYPASYTDAVTGLTVKMANFEVNATVAVPDVFPEAMKADAVAFATNLFTTALVRAMFKDGLPAT